MGFGGGYKVVPLQPPFFGVCGVFLTATLPRHWPLLYLNVLRGPYAEMPRPQSDVLLRRMSWGSHTRGLISLRLPAHIIGPIILVSLEVL